MNEQTAIFYALIAAALLCVTIPGVGIAFKTVNTLVHEMGHAVVGLLFQGTVYRMELRTDASGSATIKSKNKLSVLLSGIAGYAGSAILSYFFFRWYAQGNLRLIFWILGIAGVTALLLWVRNLYGVLWLLVFVAIQGAALFLIPGPWDKYLCLFLIGLIWVENLRCVLYLTGLSFSQSKKAGDASLLHKMIGLPTFLWALLFLAFSLYMAGLTISGYFPDINIF